MIISLIFVFLVQLIAAKNYLQSSSDSPSKLIEFSIFDENDDIYWSDNVEISFETTFAHILAAIDDMVRVKPPYRLDSCIWLLTLDEADRVITKKIFMIYSREKIFPHLSANKFVIQAHLTRGKVTIRCEKKTPKPIKKLKFYYFDNFNYTSITLNIKELYTATDIFNLTANSKPYELDDCIVFVAYNKSGLISEMFLSNISILIYPLILEQKLFAIGYSEQMQRCATHHRFCNDDCKSDNIKQWMLRLDTLNKTSSNLSLVTTKEEIELEESIVSNIYNYELHFDKSLRRAYDNVKVAQKLETYLVMQPSNTLKKLVNVGIMTNDNLSTVLDKIGNRLQIDDCILLFAIDKQNHVVNDYIIVDVKRLIRPLMSEYRMVAHLYERDQRVCTAYRYRCYDICQLQDLLTTNTPTTTIKPAHNLIYKTQQFGALTFHDEHRHVGNKSLIKLETMTPQPRLEKYSSNASAKTRVENLVSSKHHSSNNDLEEAVDDLVFDFT